MASASEPPSDRGGYSIRVASRLTGISADKLRMWERRYAFPKPERNDSGVRVYSNADVDRLILVARALKEGYRPAEAIAKSPEDLRAALARSPHTEPEESPRLSSVGELIESLRRDDADDLRRRMRQTVATLGPKRFVTAVAAPLVDTVGKEWEAGTIAVHQEHLLSEMLTTQLRLLLSAYESNAGRPVVLLVTLPGELHGLGLEMAALYLALGGAVPRLVGVDTPVEQIVEAAVAMKVDAVGVSLSTAADSDVATAHLEQLLKELPTPVPLWLGGAGARAVQLDDPRARHVVSWDELDAAVAAAI